MTSFTLFSSCDYQNNFKEFLLNKSKFINNNKKIKIYLKDCQEEEEYFIRIYGYYVNESFVIIEMHTRIQYKGFGKKALIWLKGKINMPLYVTDLTQGGKRFWTSCYNLGLVDDILWDINDVGLKYLIEKSEFDHPLYKLIFL